MLTFDSIINYLNIPQKKIDNLHINKSTGESDNINDNVLSKLEDTLSVPKFLVDINSEFNNYYYINHNYKIASFLFSILCILDKNFISNIYKDEYIKQLRQKMCYELEEKNLHKLFGYSRKKKFKKDNLQKQLLMIDRDFEVNVEKYIADYFGINIFVFEIEEENIFSYLATNDCDEGNIYKPTILLLKRDKYFPIISINLNNPNILLYSQDNIVKYLYEKFVMKNVPKDDMDIERNGLKSKKKMLLKELQNLSIKYNIDIKKKSETGKLINKTKDELYNEILKVKTI